MTAGDTQEGRNATTELAMSLAGMGGGLGALNVGRVPRGALGANVGGGAKAAALPMDEASRLARGRAAGYSDESFYRGAASHDDGRTAFYSRDPSVSSGHADKVGGTMEEYRLSVKKPVRFGEDVTLSDYVAVIREVEKTNPTAAAIMARDVPVAGNWTVESLTKLAENHGATPIMDGGLFLHALEGVAGTTAGPLRAAGFDAIDTGRDVRTLTAQGQRLKGATFDPNKAHLKDLRASLHAPSFS